MSPKSVSIPLSPEVARQLPTDPREREQVLELGVREWRIRKALSAFEREEGSLAFAARQAGVTLREMVHLAHARGLQPRIAPELLAEERMSLEEAADH